MVETTDRDSLTLSLLYGTWTWWTGVRGHGGRFSCCQVAVAQIESGDLEVAVKDLDDPVIARYWARRTEAVGAIVWLMLQTLRYRRMSLALRILPPLALKQARLYKRNGLPFEFVSWALVEEGAGRSEHTAREAISPGDWSSGKRLVGIYLTASFGSGNVVYNDIIMTESNHDIEHQTVVCTL